MPSLPPPHAAPHANAAVKAFCLALEEQRRTPDGRVRSPEEFVAHFFPHDDEIVADQLFKHIPREVRGPILSGWGIRGRKTALRDDDTRVEEAVYDALRSGDLDAASFEAGIPPQTLVDFIPLADWWIFWRTGALTTAVVQRAVLIAHDLALFDAGWFLDTLVSSDGQSRGIDTFASRLSKNDLSAWVHAIAERGDASSEGIVAALGWQRVVEHASTTAMLIVLDALVKKLGLQGDLQADVDVDFSAIDDLESTAVQSYADRKAGTR